MYRIKQKQIEKYKEWGTVRNLSEITGITEGFISQVLLGTKEIKEKCYAYAIAKGINNDLEIEDIFEII